MKSLILKTRGDNIYVETTFKVILGFPGRFESFHFKSLSVIVYMYISSLRKCCLNLTMFYEDRMLD